MEVALLDASDHLLEELQPVGPFAHRVVVAGYRWRRSGAYVTLGAGGVRPHVRFSAFFRRCPGSSWLRAAWRRCMRGGRRLRLEAFGWYV